MIKYYINNKTMSIDSFFNYRAVIVMIVDGDLNGNDSRVPTEEIPMLTPIVSTPTTSSSRREGPHMRADLFANDEKFFEAELLYDVLICSFVISL